MTILLIEVARDYPQIHEVEITNEEFLTSALAEINAHDSSIPIFMKDGNDLMSIITSDHSKLKFTEGCQLIYLGKELNFPEN